MRARWLAFVLVALWLVVGVPGAPARPLDVVLTPTNPILPKAKVGQSPDYSVTFSVKVDKERSWVVGCDTTKLGRQDLPQLNDCDKLPPGLRHVVFVGDADPACPGCLPLGWSLSGKPTKAGTYKFRIAANNGADGLIVREYTLVVEPAAKKKGADLSVGIEGPDILFVKEAANSTVKRRLLTRQVHFKFVVLVTNHGPEATAAKLTIELELPGPGPGSLPIPHEVTGDCEKALSYRDALPTINCSYAMSKGETRRAQVKLTFPTGAEKKLYKNSQYTAAELLSDLFDTKGFKIDATVNGSAKPDDPDDRPNHAVHQVRLRAR